jgi:hypothetical protein
MYMHKTYIFSCEHNLLNYESVTEIRTVFLFTF